jgi:hypothetical protein
MNSAFVAPGTPSIYRHLYNHLHPVKNYKHSITDLPQTLIDSKAIELRELTKGKGINGTYLIFCNERLVKFGCEKGQVLGYFKPDAGEGAGIRINGIDVGSQANAQMLVSETMLNLGFENVAKSEMIRVPGFGRGVL